VTMAAVVRVPSSWRYEFVGGPFGNSNHAVFGVPVLKV
jgi:hypothetical protein